MKASTEVLLTNGCYDNEEPQNIKVSQLLDLSKQYQTDNTVCQMNLAWTAYKTQFCLLYLKIMLSLQDLCNVNNIIN